MTVWTVASQPLLSMGILQARILEWVAMPSSRGSSELRDGTRISCVSCIPAEFFTAEPSVRLLSHVQHFSTPWTVAHQAPPSMGFSRQEYWSGLPFPFPGDLPNPGIEPGYPALEADTLTSEPPGNI